MMAVLNGERMHDTMERLLPGARSAALLWQGAAVLGGAALGARPDGNTSYVPIYEIAGGEVARDYRGISTVQAYE